MNAHALRPSKGSGGLAVLAAVSAALLGGCHAPVRTQALKTTVQILELTQPALNQENDYVFASRALPGALKTIEGFWITDPKNTKPLLPILSEGYCQYATAFVEDEWERAKFAKQTDDADEDNERASKMFTRCFNYAMLQLPPGFQKDIFGTSDAATRRIRSTGIDDRTGLMWAAVGLGGEINHNLDNISMISYVSVVKQMLDRVVELDAQHPPEHCDATCQVHLALPHIALGMLASGMSKQLGGDPNVATAEFQKALAITGDKLLLARTLWAYRVGLMTNDRKLFHDQLVKVLQTDPAIWPEQRLANEVAQRRARLYLAHEKELFQ